MDQPTAVYCQPASWLMWLLSVRACCSFASYKIGTDLFFPSIKDKSSRPGQPRFHRFSKEFSVRLRRGKFF